MTVPKTTGTRALLKLREERAELDQREALARREAAIELGDIVLEAGAEAISARDLKALLALAVGIGAAKAIEQLRGSTEAGAGRRGSGAAAVHHGPANGVDHGSSNGAGHAIS